MTLSKTKTFITNMTRYKDQDKLHTLQTYRIVMIMSVNMASWFNFEYDRYRIKWEVIHWVSFH